MSEMHSDARRRAMLATAMGSGIAAALADPRVLEIMVNPDGALRLDLLGEGRVDTEIRLASDEIERIIRLVASHARTEVHMGAPIVSAELPPHGEGAGERFEGILPPVSLAPCFSIRKPAARVYTLGDYVADGILTDAFAERLREAVRGRNNILIAGGTSSGKTTLANALLAEMAALDERVILIEDTRELQCPAPDTVALRTRAGVVAMADLVRSTLRLRPDRIVVGEVRGAEALDMLKAWNTGHPGGIATVHANGATAALYRLEQLVQEAVVTVPRRLVAEAIDIIVFIAGRGQARRIETIACVAGLDSDLPGNVIAQVTAPVYDSATGRTALIPQGSRIVGSYDSVVAFGQRRALVVWQRLILPDGSSVRIDNWPASDMQGYAGLADRIDRHTWQLLKGVALATLLGVGTEISFSRESDLVEAIRESTQQNSSRAGDQLVRKNLDVQPTIRVRPGWPLTVIVHKDLVLPPWKGK